MTSNDPKEYFNFLADLGMTKHYGSMDATREIIELCDIRQNQVILDIGCGVGPTPCYLVKTIGCQVVGVDLMERMLEQSLERAKREKVDDGVVSPGGVGFDINCGVRLLRTNLTQEEVRPKIKELMDALYASVPSGVAGTGTPRGPSAV